MLLFFIVECGLIQQGFVMDIFLFLSCQYIDFIFFVHHSTQIIPYLPHILN